MSEYVTVWRDHEPTKLHWGVPVVRCGDCRWYRAPLPSLGNVAMCKRNVVSAIPVDEDGFCAWGERRAEQ